MKTPLNLNFTLFKNKQILNDDALQLKIKSLGINEELIDFLSSMTLSVKEVDRKVIFLHYAKKLILQTRRSINRGHYEAFQFDYFKDQLLFDPIKWINAELEFLNAFHSFNLQSNNEHKSNINTPTPLLRPEDVEKAYRWSRTTLNRRIRMGLPYHLDAAGSKFFDIIEVNEWIKEVGCN